MTAINEFTNESVFHLQRFADVLRERPKKRLADCGRDARRDIPQNLFGSLARGDFLNHRADTQHSTVIVLDGLIGNLPNPLSPIAPSGRRWRLDLEVDDGPACLYYAPVQRLDLVGQVAEYLAHRAPDMRRGG